MKTVEFTDYDELRAMILDQLVATEGKANEGSIEWTWDDGNFLLEGHAWCAFDWEDEGFGGYSDMHFELDEDSLEVSCHTATYTDDDGGTDYEVVLDDEFFI